MNERLAIFVSGPSGAGKTTLVGKFAQMGRVYLEDIARNPYFSQAPDTFGATDALRSQRWFLEEVESFIYRSQDSTFIVVDQAPAACVSVYARYALESGLLRSAGFSDLVKCLARVERAMGERQRMEFILTGSPKVLRERVIRRDGEARCPSLEWFEKIVWLFDAYSRAQAGAIMINTDPVGNGDSSLHYRVLRAIQDGFKVRPNGNIG